MIEIRIHGTGGQGTVIAGKILAEAAARGGYHVQSFAAYGAERRGGKVESYVRISETPVLVHARMYEPGVIVLMDEALTKDPDATKGLQENGILLINSSKSARKYETLANCRVITVDAHRIAIEHGVQLPNGIPVVNTAALGALVGLLPEIELDRLTEAIIEAKVPEPQKNITAAREAYRRVVSARSPTPPAAPAQSLEVKSRLPVYRCKRPPCETHCPAGHVIHKTMAYLAKNLFEEALANIKTENPFPGICGRVCFHPCESSCNAREYSGDLAIRALERAASDHGRLRSSGPPIQREKSGKKVAIVGSGPSGMTCAYFLAQMGHSVTVFEALPVAGGIPRVAIPEYRLPSAVVEAEISQILAYGVQLKTSTRVGRDIGFDRLFQAYDACFIASGAHRPIKLNIPGEDHERVVAGLPFLKSLHTGEEWNLAAAAVAVIGGGNTAVDAARSAVRRGAQKVTIVYRRTRREMPADQKELAAAESEGVAVHYLAAPVEVQGHNGRLTALECVQTRLIETGDSKRQQVEIITNSNFRLPLDFLIVAIGETADTSFLPDNLEMTGSLIKVDGLGRTSIPGLFAGGDAANRAWNVPEAIGSGKRAAIGIDLFLKGNDEGPLHQAIQNQNAMALSASNYLAGNPCATNMAEVRWHDLNPHYFSKSQPIAIPEREVQRRLTNFEEVITGLNRTTAIEEARRCFHCGNCNLCENCYILCPEAAISVDEKRSSLMIDANLCKGCGICITECPRSAVTWEGEPE